MPTLTSVQTRVFAGDGSLPVTLRVGLDGQNVIIRAFKQQATISRQELLDAVSAVRREREHLPWYRKMFAHPARQIDAEEGPTWISAYADGMIRLTLPMTMVAHLSYQPLIGVPAQKSTEHVQVRCALHETKLVDALAWADRQQSRSRPSQRRQSELVSA